MSHEGASFSGIVTSLLVQDIFRKKQKQFFYLYIVFFRCGKYEENIWIEH